MPRIAHLSDLHFGATSPRVVKTLAHDLAASGPDYVVISGDLTQGARPREFEEAAAFLRDLPGQAFVVPGNHDLPGWNVWARLTRPYGRYTKHIDGELNPSLSTPDLFIGGLNTARRIVYHWNWSHGRVSRAQLDRVAAAAARAGAVPKLIVMHHPLIPPPRQVPQKAVTGAAKAAAAFSEMGVSAVLTGHLHLGNYDDAQDHYADVQRPLATIDAPTATSTRYRGQPNGYNLIDVSGAEIALTLRQWADGQFADVPQAVFHPEAGWRPADAGSAGAAG